MRNPNVLVNSDYGMMIINIYDTIIGKHIVDFGYYSKQDISLIVQLINFQLKTRERIVFYDVGANVGCHSLALGKTFENKISIRAFEPQRQIFNMLCGTIAINGLKNVYCHNIAVSDRTEGVIKMPVPNYSKSNNFGSLEIITALNSDNQSMSIESFENIPTTTLDYFNEQVDFIKLDIEGMEDKAMAGASSLLRNYKPICYVETLKTDVNSLIEMFKSLGYIGFHTGIDLIAIPLEYNIQLNELKRMF